VGECCSAEELSRVLGRAKRQGEKRALKEISAANRACTPALVHVLFVETAADLLIVRVAHHARDP
jgi:hypothetical protein